jgi:hypothetical protein
MAQCSGRWWAPYVARRIGYAGLLTSLLLASRAAPRSRCRWIGTRPWLRLLMDRPVRPRCGKRLGRRPAR